MRTPKSILAVSAISFALLAGYQTVEANEPGKRAYTDGSEANKPGKRAGHDSREHGYGVNTSSPTDRSTSTYSTGTSGRPSDRSAKPGPAGASAGSDPSQSQGGTR